MIFKVTVLMFLFLDARKCFVEFKFPLCSVMSTMNVSWHAQNFGNHNKSTISRTFKLHKEIPRKLHNWNNVIWHHWMSADLSNTLVTPLNQPFTFWNTFGLHKEIARTLPSMTSLQVFHNNNIINNNNNSDWL